MSIMVAEADTTYGPKSARRSRKVLYLVAGVVILLLAAGGAWFSGLLTRHETMTKNQGAAAQEKPVLLDVPDIVANLDSGLHRPVFVKLKAKIEVGNAADEAAILTNMPQILDAFQTYLRSTRPDELHGGEGTYRLREALMNRIDTIAAPTRVLDLLFVEMLIQ